MRYDELESYMLYLILLNTVEATQMANFCPPQTEL